MSQYWICHDSDNYCVARLIKIHKNDEITFQFPHDESYVRLKGPLNQYEIINDKELLKLSESLLKSGYGYYLKSIIEEKSIDLNFQRI